MAFKHGGWSGMGMPRLGYFRRMVLSAALWESIRYWDQTVLFYINQVFSNSFFDATLPWLRESAFWMPLYLFFFAFALVNFGRKGLAWILFFVLTVVACDQLGGVFKHHFHRLRPCNDPFMMEFIKLRLESCSASFSFVSNHAANHFGLAAFIQHSLKNINGFKTKWLFLWAAIICYSQMYVGIHYPTDIIAGALLGIFCGNLLAWFFNKKFALQYPPVLS